MVLVVLGSGFLALLILRAVRTYMLTRRAADLTVAVGCAWLGVTLYSQLVVGPMTVAFMIGHVIEIAAVLLVTVPAALDIKRAGASRPLVGDLTATELVASEEAYLGPRVRALMVRLERRDLSTEEHTRRVALLAARVGEELKLSATARRHLAVGGLLHERSTWLMLFIRSWSNSRPRMCDPDHAIRVRPRMKMCASQSGRRQGNIPAHEAFRPIATRIDHSPDNRRSRSGWCGYRRAASGSSLDGDEQCIDRSPDFSPCFSWRFRRSEWPSSAA